MKPKPVLEKSSSKESSKASSPCFSHAEGMGKESSIGAVFVSEQCFNELKGLYQQFTPEDAFARLEDLRRLADAKGNFNVVHRVIMDMCKLRGFYKDGTFGTFQSTYDLESYAKTSTRRILPSEKILQSEDNRAGANEAFQRPPNKLYSREELTDLLKDSGCYDDDPDVEKTITEITNRMRRNNLAYRLYDSATAFAACEELRVTSALDGHYSTSRLLIVTMCRLTDLWFDKRAAPTNKNAQKNAASKSSASKSSGSKIFEEDDDDELYNEEDRSPVELAWQRLHNRVVEESSYRYERVLKHRQNLDAFKDQDEDAIMDDFKWQELPVHPSELLNPTKEMYDLDKWLPPLCPNGEKSVSPTAPTPDEIQKAAGIKKTNELIAKYGNPSEQLLLHHCTETTEISETSGREKLTQEFPRHIPDDRTEITETTEDIETRKTSPTSGTENHAPVSFVEETRKMTPAEEKKREREKKRRLRYEELSDEQYSLLMSKPKYHPYKYGKRKMFPEFTSENGRRVGWELIDKNGRQLPEWTEKYPPTDWGKWREQPPPMEEPKRAPDELAALMERDVAEQHRREKSDERKAYWENIFGSG